MASNQIMFILFAAMIVVFSILTVTSRKILRAAVYLLLFWYQLQDFISCLIISFWLLFSLHLCRRDSCVLIIFSILLTSHISQNFESSGWKKNIFSALAALIGAILSIITILDYSFSATTEAAQEVNMKLIGKSLLSVDYDGYVLPFEVISVLLLAAMVAAIVIAKKGAPKKIGLPNLNQE